MIDTVPNFVHSPMHSPDEPQKRALCGPHGVLSLLPGGLSPKHSRHCASLNTIAIRNTYRWLLRSSLC